MDNFCFGSEPCPIPGYQALGCEYCVSYKEKRQVEPEPTPRQYFQQLKGQVLHIENKLNEHLDKSKTRVKDRL